MTHGMTRMASVTFVSSVTGTHATHIQCDTNIGPICFPLKQMIPHAVADVTIAMLRDANRCPL
jgi:hypothetical protein